MPEADVQVSSLDELRAGEQGCRRCPLYRDATQAVPGEGAPRAPIMLVGEQPGDQEDRQGRPFVGPAGRVLDRALADAEISRAQTFVTNAVKHFKHEPRGKRRLHKKPNAYEIDRCRWWLDLERALVKPSVVVAMGTTAARSLLGRAVTLKSVRRSALQLEDGSSLVVTVHPSALLRLRDDDARHREFDAFVTDLRYAGRLLAGQG